MRQSREELQEMADLLEKAGWGVLPPERCLSDMDDEFLEQWNCSKPYTMISPERGWALAEAVRYVCRSAVPGDIAECGVWKGGACLLASLILNREEPGTKRHIWLYDTFEGMVEPGREDRIAVSGQPLAERRPEGWWNSPIEDVRETLERSPLSSENFIFVPGRVEKTLMQKRPESLAILRLDTDWYESTLMELRELYPLLESGGVLLIDDYGHFTGARKAVDDYFQSREETVLLHRSDYTGRVLIKP